ncbi:MAG: SUMF1/EgtB/PvdO family nonheme iron enzyme [Chitinophagales bacterium]|nr:SUMF1/EgtB/PvdO family nonheme iron enzyme [Chitinophagales bacterium]HMU98052.1 SUMF1/EgtB/PvdO family nonheme iron enzyme [Chitinophagales bacterium]HMZ68608.1 SUMF1/EgtB/PvdO family nonheme iron enzyme [Chitinophagales bacterium]HNB39325.1 SUMF1/EgtB/PvdO family nonheme iron enzyme [Chitinophagales bacterium]HNG08445.1 SUMF1/EgtB/PvdO family nonheme iron enzyme [Chitinophagales bacterium]
MKRLLFISIVALTLASACKGGKGNDSSSTTGWKYNDKDWGGFQVAQNVQQITGPNLVLVEGGTFVMGATEDNLLYEFDNIARRVSVSSFYMDETEVKNVDYREYIYWLQRVFGGDHPEFVSAAKPDSLCWRRNLAYNEPYVKYYFTHPSYNTYPVVGVSWLQASEYCKWRTDRVNEMLLIKKGYLSTNPDQINEDNFNTEAYMTGLYQGKAGTNPGIENLGPEGGTRNLNMSDGVLLPEYRLPTEAEWEYAALGLRGNMPLQGEEVISDRRIYPWDGATFRYQKHGKQQGWFMANFMRGRGDYMGVAGALNDNAEITSDVYANFPNDFGLFNMSGNVNEWVQDVYRPLTEAIAEDLNTFRGNDFMKVSPEEGLDEKGRIKYVRQDDEELANRFNYRKAFALDYNDGDSSSFVSYNYGISTLINNKSRVYKGGSWRDRGYYLSPGTRRFINEDQSSDDLGFRCAMVRVGSPDGNIFGGKGFTEMKKTITKNQKARKF